MSYGFRAYGPDGQVQVTVDSNLTQIRGVFSTGTSNGSRTDFSLASGTPFCGVLNHSGSLYLPTVSVSGTTISWTFSPGGFNESALVFYGVS